MCCVRCDLEILLELLIILNANCFDRIDEHYARLKYKKNKEKENFGMHVD